MDYKLWLKAFTAELHHVRPDVKAEDLDSLFLQSLFQKGVPPTEAAHGSLVFSSIAEEHHAIELDFGAALGGRRWQVVVPILVFVLVCVFLFRPRPALSSPNSGSVRHLSQEAKTSDDVSNGYNMFSTGFNQVHEGNANRTNSKSKPKNGLEADSGTSENGDEDADDNYDDNGGGSENNDDSYWFSLPPTTAIRAARTSSSSQGGGSAGAGMQAGAEQDVPVIEQFQVSSLSAASNGWTGLVTWQVANADQVQLLLVGTVIPGTDLMNGNLPFENVPEGAVYTLRASRNGRIVEATATVEAMATGY